MKFRKKPVVIEAIQWTGDNYVEVNKFVANYTPVALPRYEEPKVIVIVTLEGEMKCRPGSWIIKGVEDEFYPCKPDIFEKTYEAVEEERALERQGKEEDNSKKCLVKGCLCYLIQ